MNEFKRDSRVAKRGRLGAVCAWMPSSWKLGCATKCKLATVGFFCEEFEGAASVVVVDGCNLVFITS